MGGSALLIYGTPSPELLKPRAAPRSMLSRLFSKPSATEVKEHQLGSSGHALITVPCEPLAALADEFRAFVAQAFPKPWSATEYIKDYLADRRTITIYLRGDRAGDAPPTWYVQVSFSAAAGMCDTSAEVAAHWADIWYRQRGAELAARHLLPFGFTPDHADGPPQTAWFVPIGPLGYALFYADDDPLADEARHFELDHAVVETFEDNDLTTEWREMAEALKDVRTARRCLCQFCAPELDQARFESLAITRNFGESERDGA